MSPPAVGAAWCRWRWIRAVDSGAAAAPCTREGPRGQPTTASRSRPPCAGRRCARGAPCLRQLGAERAASGAGSRGATENRKKGAKTESNPKTNAPIRPHSFAPRAAVKAARQVDEFPPRRTGHGRAGAARGVQPLAGLRVFDVRPERRGAAAGDAAAETAAAEGEPPTSATHSTARGARRAR
jgi:hypothetical protein